VKKEPFLTTSIPTDKEGKRVKIRKVTIRKGKEPYSFSFYRGGEEGMDGFR